MIDLFCMVDTSEFLASLVLKDYIWSSGVTKWNESHDFLLTLIDLSGVQTHIPINSVSILVL